MARFAWLGWGLPVALVFFLGLREIGTADFWWQWATGRHILENGIPTHDPWLTTAEPRSWIELRWIYCVGLYWIVENVGAWLAIFLAAAMYASAVALALISGGKAAPSWLAATGVTAAALIGRRLVVRPEAFTLLFLALLLFLIVRVRQSRLKPSWALLWIALIQILWANTHALFALGWVVCGIWFVVELFQKSDRRKTALLALLITVACSFINPYGAEGAMFPFLLFEELHVGAYRNNIMELRSPIGMGFTPSLVAHLLMAVAVFVLAIKKRGDAVMLLVSVATLYLSLTVVRNAPLFALSSVAFISTCNLKPARPAAWVAGIAGVMIAYSFAIGTWTLEDRIGLRIAEERYPIQSARSLKGAEGTVFNTLVEGSLLIAQGDKAYCDPRLEVLPQARFLEMLAISRLQKPLPQHFDFVLLRLDSPLAGKLVKHGGWRLLGIDTVAIALARDEGHSIETVEMSHMIGLTLPMAQPDFSWFRRAQSPVPYRRMATFFRNIGDQRSADEMMREARRVYPTR